MKHLTLILALIALVAAGTSCAAVPPTMTVDGQPFFPLGWYCSTGSSVYPDQKAQGMNSVLSCYGNWTCGSCQTTYARDAAAVGMKILFEVHRYAVQELSGYPLSLIDDQVNLLKNEPNLIGWYLIDEPELQDVTPEMAQARYAQIKGLDPNPNHPISVVHSANEDWRPSRADGYLYREPPPYTDILMTDTYVVYDGYPEFANAIWKTASTTSYHVQRAIQTGKQGYINVVQTHEGWGLRIPTYAEQRYLSYSPIVFGARGLLYWMYNAYTTETHKQTVVAPIAREIRSLIPAILSNSTAVTITSNRDTDTLGHKIPDVAYLFGTDENGGYLVAVNNTANTITVNLTLTGDILANLAPDNLQSAVLFEGRGVTLQTTANPRVRTISDSFSPYDVNVYRLYCSGPTASVDLGSPDMNSGLAHLQTANGNTTTVYNHDGVNCRKNLDPASDSLFCFAVDETFAYQGSSQDLSIAVDYYDSGTGSLELLYDSVADAYKSGGSFGLTNTNTWKTHTFHVTDAYFGNRQNGGADFRLSGSGGLAYYLDKVTVTTTDPATPGPVTGFTATPDIGSVTLNWTNPVNPTLVGTMIRYKTGGYPTSPTDGSLLCYRQSPTPGSADSILHSGLSGVTCYYTAFTYNTRLPYATAQVSATPLCAPGLAQNYDDYSDGTLGGQDNWTTTGSASAQVQAAYAKGGTGKAVLMDEVTAGGVTITNELSALRTVGYYYLSFDIAQDIVGGSSGPISATVAICASNSTEIAKLRVQKGKLSLDPNLLVSQAVNNLAWCNVKIGLNIATRKLDVWFDDVLKFGNYDWKNGSGSDIGKIVISSVRYTGFSVQKTYIDNLALDAAPATVSSIADDGAYTPSLDKLHFSFDQAACSGGYRYCIGTTSGGSETRGWTSCGLSTNVTAAGLSLAEGQQYFISVQSGNGSGLWGQSAISDGITVAAGTTIPAAKGLADSEIRALRGKTVSAVFPDCFYVQEPNKPYGIKVISTAAVSEGQTVDVAGEMKGAGAERYIDATGNALSASAGPGAPGPLAISNRALGGSAQGPLAPGVTDGVGANNIGLLVRCWGKVSNISGVEYQISDGSGVIVNVRAPDLASVPQDGTFALATGISCRNADGSRLIRALPN